MTSVHAIDSHTGGEPTRVVIHGGPDLPALPLADLVTIMREKHDGFRQAVVLEPRGSDVMVAALLCEAHAPDCVAGVIFFNNVGYLGMCGHGLIGVIATLAYLGRISSGTHRIDTPVGVVGATLHPDGQVTITNVPSRRTVKDLTIDVPGLGPVTGDVAWGGNWFFLVNSPNETLSVANAENLTALSWKIRLALNSGGYPEIDHVELFGPPSSGGDSRNFVLCPGKAYDRSPCGTGTSAKLACLAADGKLAENTIWTQESIVGSIFRASYQWHDSARGEILPQITGQAYVMAESQLLFHNNDPFANGIR